ncbi:YbfB/YjiJ family MFS transporter [Catenulispora rubra]|uniref:YbfB/YjiJ family MFS transporter n=1 Tax=Catenulispora rubra TaxID=280293 RepID=UPI001E2DB8B9|nr:YbfB/YjiJ family MFS transporter [Catenulispora rubra]
MEAPVDGVDAGPDSSLSHTLRAAAALAAAVGVGRFVYTPILPLMHAQAGLGTSAGAGLATANYAGYLAGALLCTAVPVVARSRVALRCSLLALVASLALMPAGESVAWWWILRLAAGATSAVVFVIAVHALLNGLHGHRASLAGWGFGGVGAGIALSGAAVLVVRGTGDWRTAWWAAAALALVLGAVAWKLAPGRATSQRAGVPQKPERAPQDRRLQTALLVSYSLDGLGYIIAGTFLVAAISQSSPGWVGTGAWVLVGLAAVPSAAWWAGLGRRFSTPGLLAGALLLQSFGIVLPALAAGVVPALISAVLFGATFVAISQLALGIGNQLGSARSAAVLTTGYSVGQILGPLAVTPALHHGYRQALVWAAVVVLAAAVVAATVWAGLSRDRADAGRT